MNDSKLTLHLKPIVPTPEIMSKLEEEGLIRRLNPQNGTVGQHNHVRTLYATDGTFGGHKLIHVTICEHHLNKLTSHPEPEEFILIGPRVAVPLLLLIARSPHAVMEQKIKGLEVTSDDFYCLIAPFHDPELLCFTMKENIPHAELLARPLADADVPPTFYVTESSYLPENDIALQGITIMIDHPPLDWKNADH